MSTRKPGCKKPVSFVLDEALIARYTSHAERFARSLAATYKPGSEAQDWA